ncbi:MAG: MurR/RpiR family transcriptional regulator [Pseudophaeobacter sp. bin_em_oilr2.035]|uniref:MurR/RpiR family transcriptional regulator n=1 Tax=Phaeobacter gallaeciensis TaxID=60890 RepID=A0ABD4XCX0_9RHOB|nr:MurR/RpiR family transcriptional regulator [Phaeobacter gallaeciensis]MDF1773677.1 MurR/RpiR family transcriptional regulator [Pseudophaeobacter sp. bin_em_oilr2.035]MEE2634208.1 MurR/RpiR family transcriptional regulator [Pseudomonadota bacterium]MDE4062679.1 MurR/RpiR family transcriptional regulator [Phaeobacter gallaeciensis]MDE4125557.1 MurR/RpiR family transcriptional regulator [Phaeobacter gallaeciensis]MDE4130125.1 MurR/RpiR family transcriptional regulator [Phaeobacter gallaeciensi
MNPQLDPKQTARLLATLKDGISHMPPKLAAAAKYIIDNPGDFALDPVRLTATKAGISANTLVRLAEHLGFDSFEALRTPFRTALVTGQEAGLGEDWLAQMQTSDTPSAALQARAARNEINIVARSLRLMTPERTAAIVETLTSARRCYVTATRASYALAHYFHYVGRMALPDLDLVPRHMGSAMDDLIDLSAEDCLIAITFAPYSSGTIQALRMAAKRGAKVVLISDSEVIAPGIHADHVLAVASNSLHAFGAYGGAMAVLECLLTHLITAGGDTARRRIEAYEDLRQDSGAYWSGPKLPRTGR